MSKPLLPAAFALAIAGHIAGVSAAPLPATLTESVYGACGSTRSYFGTDDSIGELLSIDLQATFPNGHCLAAASSSVIGSTAPQIDLQGQAVGGARVSGSGQVQYSMTIAGPVGNDVPIAVSAFISVSGSASGDNAYGVARGEIIGLPIPFNGNIVVCSWFGYSQPSCPFGPADGIDWDINTSTVVRSGTVYEFTLKASATAVAGTVTEGGAADYQIIVDPVFSFVNSADAELYSFQFSPNLTPVPLPAGCWLVASALVVLRGCTRRPRARGQTGWRRIRDLAVNQ
ncbi:MAG: hypothetical protein H6978_13205 [Gammaproteobacteria bacterium]|nr:hypothetical protein [Gammaproteobacteria bacterium]